MTLVHGTLAADERRRWLTERLRADGSVTLAQAAESLGVSEMTIRRDLDELQERAPPAAYEAAPWPSGLRPSPSDGMPRLAPSPGSPRS